MSDTKIPEAGGGQPAKLDLDVKVFPSQKEGNLLAMASITLGGCFAIRGIKIMDSEKGAFIAMPDRKDSKGEYHDICFPTTKEMREALNSAVMGEYQRTVGRIASRGEKAMQPKTSVLENLQQKTPQASERPAAPRKRADREAR